MAGTEAGRQQRRWPRHAAALGCLGACAALLAPVPARSDTEPAPAGLATLVPNSAASPSHLKIDAEGSAGGLEPDKVPTSLAFAFQKGFEIDPQAVPGVCTNSDADNKHCPDNSRFASGTINLTGHGTAFGANGQQFTADVALYVGEPQRPGDPAGAVFYYIEPTSGYHDAFRGRIDVPADPTYGTEIRFDNFSLPPLPPGYSFDLQSLKLDVGTAGSQPPAPPAPSLSGPPLGASPGASGKPRRRRRRRHRPVRHRRDHAPKPAASATAAAASSFLTNPATCAGSWSIRLQIGFSDGVQERDASAPCTT